MKLNKNLKVNATNGNRIFGNFLDFFVSFNNTDALMKSFSEIFNGGKKSNA